MHRSLMVILAVFAIGVCSPAARAAVRLIGITGNQEANAESDESLYEINLTTAATTKLFQLTHIPDTDSIGFNPVDGLLYHFSGSETYSDNPGSNGYRDHQYMETVNLDTQALTAIFNANGPPSPDSLPAFGLAAPRPDWVLPTEVRTEDQTDHSFGSDLRGPDEFHGARGFAWSATENLFYISDEHGIYKLTTSGDSTFVGQPTQESGSIDVKGIAFVTSGATTKLYAGTKGDANLYEIDPATGQQIGTPIEVMAPLVVGGEVEPTGKILGLTQHPETGVLYGITEPIGGDPLFNRQLVTIDLTTGIATLIGELHTPASDAAFANIAFVGFSSARPGDADNDGDIDGTDFILIQRGFGTTFGPADMAAFKAGFGTPEVAVAGAVPEPAALALACLALGAATMVRRKLS